MKLYTEKQVIKAIEMAQNCDHDCGGVYFDYGTSDAILEELTPIELPTDEEIEKESFDLYANHNTYSLNVRQYKAFKKGAKWMRDKIQEQ
jgi:Zn-finger nucleic acid-binding protein